MPNFAESRWPIRLRLAWPNVAMKTSSFSRRMATLPKGSSRSIEPDSDGTNSFAFCRICRRTRSRSMSLLSESPAFWRSRKRSSCGVSSAWNCIVRMDVNGRLYGLLPLSRERFRLERDRAIRVVRRHPAAPVPYVFRDVAPDEAEHAQLACPPHVYELVPQQRVARMSLGDVDAPPERDGDRSATHEQAQPPRIPDADDGLNYFRHPRTFSGKSVNSRQFA